MRTCWIVLAAALAMASTAMADGMIIPILPVHRVSGQWAVKYHHVDIKVEDQVARVNIDQAFENVGSGNIEVEYMFPVPPDAAIDSMTLSVDGKDYKAQLYKADEARKMFEEIVRTKKDPALLEYVGFGMMKTSAFPLAPGKPAKVIVTYKQTLKKDQDLVQLWYPLNTEKFSAKPIDEVTVQADIRSKADITAVYSPSHDVTVERKDQRHVVVSYSEKKSVPTTDFLVYYKEANEDVGASLLTHQPTSDKDGYFMLLASPNPGKGQKSVMAKDVILVLDHSGSMHDDKKLEQAKGALTYILNNLNTEDRFNVVFFSDSVETLFESPVAATGKNIKEAKERVDHLDATGGTNIDKAMADALKQLSSKNEDRELASRPHYIIFLTDGQPTVGVTDESTILKNIGEANKDKTIRIFAFGVGYDVNVRLLDKLSAANAGRSDYVKPKENVETKVTGLYAKIKNPVMTNIKVKVTGLRLREMYPQDMPDLFDGDQIVLTGRYFGEDVSKLAKEGDVYHTQLVLSGTYMGQEKTFEYPVTVQPQGQNWRYDFVEKIWAVRRVGFLLDQIQLHGKNQEIIDELVRLSKDYGIMTPYTSFLADERTALSKGGEMHKLADKAAKELEDIAGDVGQRGAMNRQVMRDANQAPAPGLQSNLAAADSAPAMTGSGMYGNSSKDSYEAGKKERVATVQNAGGQAMYRRGQMWVASNASAIDPEKDKEKIKVVDRFSKEYFELVRANTVQENQVLSTQGDKDELLVTLRGQAYLFK